MTAQPLFEPPEPVVNLTDRQQFVLDALRRHQEDGLSSDEVGALLCERKGRHDAGVRCDWDSSNGHSVLNALRKKGLARRRRGGTWVALRAEEPQAGVPADGGPDLDSVAPESSSALSASDGEDIPF